MDDENGNKKHSENTDTSMSLIMNLYQMTYSGGGKRKLFWGVFLENNVQLVRSSVCQFGKKQQGI